MEENRTLPAWSWPVAVALFILTVIGAGLTPFAPLKEYWLATLPLYFFSLGLTSLVLYVREEKTEADLYQWLVRALLPLALIGVIGIVLLFGAETVANVLRVITNLLILAWVLVSFSELGIHLVSAFRGTGRLSGGSFSEIIISLLGKMFIPATLDKIKLKAGEKVLLVTFESKWKNVYKKTVLAFFQKLLIAIALAIGADFVVLVYLFFTNISPIIQGKFNPPLLLLVAIGVVCIAVVEVPVVVYRYHMEELSRRLLKIIVTNQQIIVWAVVVPFGYGVSSTTPLTEVKDVTSGPVGGFKPSDVEKKEGKPSLFDRWWAGVSYRMIQARTVNLPSQLQDASDKIQLDRAVAWFMDVLSILVGEAKAIDERSKAGKTMLTNSQIYQSLLDQGVSVQSHATVADPLELAAALKKMLNPESLPERFVDAFTLDDPGFCRADGTVDLTAIRGVKASATSTTTAAGIGFKRVPRPEVAV